MRIPDAGLRAVQGNDHVYGPLDYVGDITSIPVPDGSFDAVLCTEVLEHVPHPELAVRELARVLRPGGRILITAPLGSGIHMPPYHYHGGFTPYWYSRFLLEAGIEISSGEANRGFFKLYGQESQRFLYLLTRRSQAALILFFP